MSMRWTHSLHARVTDSVWLENLIIILIKKQRAYSDTGMVRHGLNELEDSRYSAEPSFS